MSQGDGTPNPSILATTNSPMKFTSKDKHIWESKTFWLNSLALIAILGQMITGKEILNPALQTSILAMINLLLRIITNRAISW